MAGTRPKRILVESKPYRPTARLRTASLKEGMLEGGNRKKGEEKGGFVAQPKMMQKGNLF